MPTPAPPPGEGHPGRPPDDGARPGDADPFLAAEPDADETPTVISRFPRPVSEDVFGGTLRGRRLAHFELIEPIGVGGMAAVIRARDLQLERQVALKILPPEMAADEENVRRFHQEARAAARLDHENIARVFFCGEDQKLHFIAFEFVEGLNLRALLERRGRLPVAEALRYLLQVATGLAHAAERGVIHRDIKPSNIIISPHGRAKLVDMGLARQLGPHQDQALTQSGVTLGTFDYISPEQALEPREADVRSDLYSLGCTFYHALTGQPPVPEGTAARKLHHHQHVAPVDPRQLNPDVPDEVAAILARMMAKDPKARYQRPEHLVQHLMQVAQKLGALTEVPEGVLFVDAPLPSPPRPRPVLTAVLALLALVALVLLLGRTAPNRPPSSVPGPAPSAADGGAGARAEQPGPPADEGRKPKDEGQGTKDVATAAARPESRAYDADKPKVPDVQEFLRQVADKGQTSHVYLAQDVDLTDLGAAGPGLVFDGSGNSTVILEPRNRGQRPTVRLKLDAGSSKLPDFWAALTVKGGQVIVRNLRFVVDAAESPGSKMAALLWQGGRLQVDNCEFVQAEPAHQGDSRLSAVELAGPGPGPAGAGCPVVFTHCCFLSNPPQDAVAGQYAVTVTAGGHARFANCAFGPHAAVVAFLGSRARDQFPDARVELDHCSTRLAGESAVVRLENADRNTPALAARSCLFSWADRGPAQGEPAAALVHQTDEASSLSWSGADNRYHNLDAFWQRPGEAATDLAGFQALPNVQEEGARPPLGTSPWLSEQPLRRLDPRNAAALWEAFRVKPQLRELRLPDGKGLHLAGVEQFLGSPPYTDGLRVLEAPRPERLGAHDKVVDLDPNTRRPGDFSSLSDALKAADPGDTILLRCGDYPLEPVRLNKAGLDVTLKPYPGCRPVLTLDPGTDEEEAALFRLHDGKLRLEGLQVRLRPANGKFKSQTVVAALGEGECTFKDCVITLEQAHDARLAVVTLADLPGVMKMDRPERAPGQRAAFKFQNCFVRGDGDLIAARAGRPFDLDADNLLVALGGSFLNREAADDAATAPADAADAVRLAHVTAYLGGHLVRFRAKDTRALVPAQFKSVSDCLFVSAGDKALVHLDGAEASDERLAALLGWSGQHNAYTDFPELLDQQPDNGAMPAMPYNRDRWKTFAHETDAAFDRVKLDNRPAADAPLAAVTPARFRVKPDDMHGPDMQPYGADLDQLPPGAAPADAVVTPPDDG